MANYNSPFKHLPKPRPSKISDLVDMELGIDAGKGLSPEAFKKAADFWNNQPRKKFKRLIDKLRHEE